MNRTLWEMHLRNRYKEILFILDTCEASTLFDNVDVPNVYFVGSSLKDQKATSYLFDHIVLSPLSDRFTFLLGSYLEQLLEEKKYSASLDYLFREIGEKSEFLNSDIAIRNSVGRDVNIFIK